MGLYGRMTEGLFGESMVGGVLVRLCRRCGLRGVVAWKREALHRADVRGRLQRC